ncbi:MAG TPA: hypothetical protein EYG28_08925 [Nitrospiria bacterium]|nr:hypothetical protein [Candidatus Manganitrophaceae bacterium]HIL35495.1 hypothetical protein [Candidatus Manganitrophaceae bacterium]
MKEKKHYRMRDRFAVMFFILLFIGQHSVICWSASSLQSFGEYSDPASRHMDKGGSHSDATSMETDCNRPCHLTTMKVPRLVLNISYNSGIKKVFQEVYSPEGIIPSIFHPPRFASTSSRSF